MSPLDVVLIIIICFLLFAIALYFLWQYYVKKLMSDKRKDYEQLDSYTKAVKSIFLGDSLTEFFPLHEFFDSACFKNRGIAGETTDDIKNRITSILKLKPENLILQIGINDLINKSSRKCNAENLSEKILSIAKQFSGISQNVIVVSLLPINRKKHFYSKIACRKATNKRITEVNKLVAEKLNEYISSGNSQFTKYIFCNVYNCLTDKNGNLDKNLTLEGLHLNAKGYIKIYEAFVTSSIDKIIE